jgi:tRNA-specific 2-thiouridylase
MPVRAGQRPVAVAFSGGKDSTAAVLLLREQGYAVRALTMRLGLPGEDEKLSRIERLARTLGVPWQVSDLSAAFRRKVLDDFIGAYRRGLTPNPCVLCNRRIKFGLLLEQAVMETGGGLLATGHYADKVLIGGPEGPRRGEERWFLREPADRGKSQIYFLAMVDPTALARVFFPLAGLFASEVRTRVAGLPLANVDESQDACFLQDETLASYLSRHIPESFAAGDIIDVGGKKIGRHRGAIHFTVGQRRGTDHASDRRLYVAGRDLEANTVTLGEEKDLLSGSVTVAGPVYWRPLQAGERLAVKVRYQRHGYDAEIAEVSESHIQAIFKKPVRAVTPGQFAVFYDNDLIVAAGEIAGDK